jgi:hypothetical protein
MCDCALLQFVPHLHVHCSANARSTPNTLDIYQSILALSWGHTLASLSLLTITFMVRNETDKNTNLLADFAQAAQGVMVEWAANRVGVGVRRGSQADLQYPY